MHIRPSLRLCSRMQEQEQLAAIRDNLQKQEQQSGDQKGADATSTSTHQMDRDFEGGFGGQEDLEDRYATTSGEH